MACLIYWSAASCDPWVFGHAFLLMSLVLSTGEPSGRAELSNASAALPRGSSPGLLLIAICRLPMALGSDIKCRAIAPRMQYPAWFRYSYTTHSSTITEAENEFGSSRGAQLHEGQCYICVRVRNKMRPLGPIDCDQSAGVSFSRNTVVPNVMKGLLGVSSFQCQWYSGQTVKRGCPLSYLSLLLAPSCPVAGRLPEVTQQSPMLPA